MRMPSMARPFQLLLGEAFAGVLGFEPVGRHRWYPIGWLFWSEYHDVSFQGELAAGKLGCTRKHRRALSWFDHDPPG